VSPVLVGFIRKELVQSLRDVRMRLLIFVMPVVQLAIFGLALSTEVRNIRLAAVFEPGDVLARRVVERCFASKWFLPAAGGTGDPVDCIRSGKAEAVFVAPAGGLTRAVERGDKDAQLLVDGLNALRARGVEGYFQTIFRATVADWKRAPPPVFRLSARVLYNPMMETSVFLVPGVLAMVLAVVTVILTCMSLAREKEIGTFEAIVAAPLGNHEILLGKTLPYVLLGLVDATLVVATAVFGFGVPLRGPVWEMGLASVFFILTTVSLAVFISTFAENQQQAMMGGFLFLFPSVLLSGLMFPLENMPRGLYLLTYLDPLRYFITLARNIMLKGGEPSVVAGNLLGLAILGASTAVLAFKRFRQTLN